MRPLAALAAVAVSLALTAPAYAGDNGEGLVGETDDRIITFSSLGVIVFFVLVVTVGSVIQHLLEKRKEQRRALELRRRIGW
jgi:hypothetical protein